MAPPRAFLWLAAVSLIAFAGTAANAQKTAGVANCTLEPAHSTTAPSACADLIKAAGADTAKLADAHAALAKAYRAAENLDAADEAATMALRYAPQRAASWFERGQLRFERGQYLGAAADFSVAIRYEPHNADAYIARGESYRSLGALIEAVADASKALEIDPASAQALANRAYAQLRRGRIEDAIADADRAVALSPKLAKGYLARGLAREKDDRAAASADLARALELDRSLRDLDVLKPVIARLGL